MLIARARATAADKVRVSAGDRVRATARARVMWSHVHYAARDRVRATAEKRVSLPRFCCINCAHVNTPGAAYWPGRRINDTP